MYLKISFPSGHFHGAEAHDPSMPEWPPHPSRLYSALVASAYCAGNGMTPQKRQALEWLESQPPPHVIYPDANLLEAPISYVPTGDRIGQKGKKGEEQFEHPVHSWRQPRHFPYAIILGDPVLYYYWPDNPDEKKLLDIDEIASDVTHVGTSHSMVTVSAHSGETGYQSTLFPSPNGSMYLRIISPGRLAELDEINEQSFGVRRPLPSCEFLAGYARPSRDPEKKTGAQLISLRLTGTMHGASTAVYLARNVRRAVMSVLGDEAPPIVHGHGKDGHVGWLPLPDVGHPHASGRIVGIGIMIPADADENERNKVLSGIGMVREVRLPDGRAVHLSPLMPGERVPAALMPKTWSTECRTWASVTPVVLDRPPKKLTEERVRSAVGESLVLAGYPVPSGIKVSSFSIFNGGPPAFRVPAEKPRFHAVVQFKNPVEGPIIAGRLRYFGIGMFRPVHDLD